MDGVANAGGVRPRAVGIVDDHEMILDGMSNWIGAHAPDLDVVIRSSSWVEMARHPAFPPELVIMDLQLKEPISVEARIRICLSVGARVVVMSALDSPETVERVLAAGAAAFVSKSRPASDLVRTARSVLGVAPRPGDAWDDAPRPIVHGATASSRFTEEEEETLRLYASGHSPVEVAMIRGTNIQAVKNALERIRQQYADEGRVADKKQELMLRAAEDGYLS
ncbi:response regulator transcription factor [Herbiconiux sp. CPCC 205763]|uniref:Response regulator transcription factor n=1 Tax=Herbiconiux aconitum TaxID=2970913 RepID=A0ABT2GPU4_9MICO|nr:response regulator transcription factor [Herbiconiux aconitum]MCS5716791.1 response regulator transcription factor [Herbiconiux aconitum]